MKRYAVCKVLGNGTIGNPFRAAISDVVDPSTGFKAFNYSVVLASDENGLPVYDWCLVIAAGENFKLLDGNEDIDLLPEVNLDMKVSAIHGQTKLEMGANLQARGIDTSFIGNADGFREVPRGLGKIHDPNFDEKQFDVSE